MCFRHACARCCRRSLFRANQRGTACQATVPGSDSPTTARTANSLRATGRAGGVRIADQDAGAAGQEVFGSQRDPRTWREAAGAAHDPQTRVGVKRLGGDERAALGAEGDQVIFDRGRAGEGLTCYQKGVQWGCGGGDPTRRAWRQPAGPNPTAR